MEKICGATKPHINAGRLGAEHMRIKDKSLRQVYDLLQILITNLIISLQFQSKRKMGGEEFSLKHLKQLEIDLEENFNNYKAYNENKRLFRFARTPAAFFAVAVVMYIFSGAFGLFELYNFANLCNLIMGIALLTVVMSVYIR